MSALFVGFIVSTTAILTVVLGILGAYCAINGILTALNPALPSQSLRALVPHQSQVSGD